MPSTSLRSTLRRLLSLALALTALLGVARAQNWIVNGDAETGSTAGWTAISGGGLQATSSVTAVYAGAWSLTGGVLGAPGALSHELRQNVDVSSLSSLIDAGSAVSVFSCAGRSNAANNVADPGRVRLEYLDAGGVVLAQYDTGVFFPYNAWNTYGDTRLVPVGTRTVRVRLLASRPGGSSTDAFFDALDLQLEPAASPYCSAKTNSQGCVPTIFASGAARLGASTLVVSAGNVLNQKSGILFYGFAPSATPFQGGTLCIAPPTIRTQVQSSGGSPTGNDCSGVYSYDWSSSVLSAAGLSVGQVVYCQYWSRDPAIQSTTGLTAAVRFRVVP